MNECGICDDMPTNTKNIYGKTLRVTQEHWGELAIAIGPGGTNHRKEIISAFYANHTETSERQINELYGSMVVRQKPECIPPHEKPSNNKQMWHYLRPHFYSLIPEDQRPPNYEELAAADKLVYEAEEQKKALRVATSRAKERAKKQKQKDMMEMVAGRANGSISPAGPAAGVEVEVKGMSESGGGGGAPVAANLDKIMGAGGGGANAMNLDP